MQVPARISSLVRRLVAPTLADPAGRTYDRILEEIDWESFEALRARYPATPDEPYPKAKYFEFQRFLPGEVRRARLLGLHALPPRRVLDIGCGFGYYALVCRHLGHFVMGIDLPRSAHDTRVTPCVADLYDDACDLFEIPRTLLEIHPFEPLPDLEGAPFHFVSANHVTFNGHDREGLWGSEEWGYFLDDLGRQLTCGARVLLGLNAESATGHYYTDELRAFFEGRGARIDGNTVDLTYRSA